MCYLLICHTSVERSVISSPLERRWIDNLHNIPNVDTQAEQLSRIYHSCFSIFPLLLLSSFIYLIKIRTEVKSTFAIYYCRSKLNLYLQYLYCRCKLNLVDVNFKAPGFFLVKVSISVSTIEGITGKGL